MAKATVPDKPKRPRTNLLSVRLVDSDSAAVRRVAERTGQSLNAVLARIASELSRARVVPAMCRTIGEEYIAQVRLELTGESEEDDLLPEPRMSQAQGISLAADDTFGPEGDDFEVA